MFPLMSGGQSWFGLVFSFQEAQLCSVFLLLEGIAPQGSQMKSLDASQCHSKKILNSNFYASGTRNWLKILLFFLSHFFYDWCLTNFLCSLISKCVEGKLVWLTSLSFVFSEISASPIRTPWLPQTPVLPQALLRSIFLAAVLHSAPPHHAPDYQEIHSGEKAVCGKCGLLWPACLPICSIWFFKCVFYLAFLYVLSESVGQWQVIPS